MASFGKTFSAARKAGKSEFTWKGKSFNTKLAGETPSRAPKPSAAARGSSGSRSANVPTPTAAPRGASGASRSTAGKVVKSQPNYGIAKPTSPMGRAISARHNPSKPANSLSGGSLFGGAIKWGNQTKPSIQNRGRRK